MSDDYAGDTGTIGTVAVGGSVTGEIERRYDLDWFAVTFEAGKWYRIDLEGSPTTAGTLRNPYIRGVCDADGNYIRGTFDDDGGVGRNSRVYFEAENAGTHYIVASGYGDHGDRIGTYRVSVAEIPDDHSAGTATTGTVAVGGSAAGEIERPHDQDWFAVTLEAGKWYRIDLEGSPTDAGTLTDPYLRGVYDASGNYIRGTYNDDWGVGRNSRVFFEAENAGTHYIAAGASSAEMGTYGVSVAEVADDHPAETGTTGTVAVGGSATGEIERAGDRDWFAVMLEAGKTYRIDLEGSSTTAGTLADPYLSAVYDANGNYIRGTSDDDRGVGRNSRVFFEAENTGTHYIVAAGDGGDDIGTYGVSVAEIADDHSAGTGTTGTVAVDGSATGEIEYDSDRDWFAVTLEAGKWYRIDLEGSPTTAGTLTDPYLRGVHDANGNYIRGTYDNDRGVGRNSLLFFEAENAGTYYIAAGAGGDRTGSYRVSVSEVADNHAAGIGTSGTVAVGGSATGEIELPHDRDWFAVTLEAGRSYRIDLEGSPTDAGTLTDPYLRGVYDASGNYIPGTYDNDWGAGRNSRVFFEAENTGTHYIAAGAAGAGLGTYRVSVAEFADDHPAGTGTTGTVAVDGSATGEIERPFDTDWFAVTLEAGKWYRIDLEGSPTDAGTLGNPYLRGVRDANGNLIPGTYDRNGGVGWNSRVFLEPENAGTYYIAAGVYGTGFGTYRVSVAEIVDDHTAGIDTTGTVAVGGSTMGEIDYPHDHDWFAVTLEAVKWYRIDIEGSRTNAGTLLNPWIRSVYDADGNRQGAWNSHFFYESRNAGTYFIATSAAISGTGTPATGTYHVSVTEVAADDYASDTGTTGTVAVGGSATGEMEHWYDRDWFAVTLEAGKWYRIDLEGSDTNAGTLRSTHLRGVHDADGNLIPDTSRVGGGVRSNSRVFFEAEDAGTYYIAAAGFGTGTYRVSVAEVADDHSAGTDTSGTVAVGGSATGEIEHRRDDDWFAVTLEAGKLYRIDLEGSPTTAGTLSDPYLRGVHDANGDLIGGTTDNDGGAGRNSRLFFEPEDAGTYYIATGGSGDRTGTYRVSVAEVNADDHPAGTGTSGTVAVGGSATGEIEHRHDLDWFAVTLEAGKEYRIDLEGSPTTAGTLTDPYLRGVHDANGNLIGGTTDNDEGDGRNSRLFFEPGNAGTYYIAAGANGDGIGTYRVSVAEFVDDHPAGAGTTGTVAVDGSATGEIERAGDRDWFAVTLEAGRLYRIDLEGSPTNAGTLTDPYLRGVHDANGNLVGGTIDDDGGTGRNSRLFFEPESAGTYYIAAGAYHDYRHSIGTYRVSVQVSDDYAAGTGTTGTVAVGGSATGEIGLQFEMDWFAVTLEAGRKYRIDLEGSHTDAGTLLDPYLRGIYDADGNLIRGTLDDDGGVGYNSRLVFEPENAGTHYIAASNLIGSSGTYRLSVEKLDDHPAETGTRGTVAVGGTATGEIERAGDRDWFAVTLEAGKEYRIDLEGSPTDAGTLRNPYLRGVHDADGNRVRGTTDNNGGTGHNARLLFEPENSGTYYIAAGANGDRTGTYRVSVAEVVDDHSSGTGTTRTTEAGDSTTGETERAGGTVAVGGSATGEIERAGDRDWFAVTLEAGKEYRVDLEGSPTNAGTLANPYLRGVHDADGNLIRGATDDDGGTGLNSRLFFEAENSGTHYIAAGANGAEIGTYRVSVAEVVDDHPAGTGTTGTVAVGGSATGEIERAGDQDWFAVTLEAGKEYRVDLEGSPTSAGTLANPYLRGVHDADGNRIRGTTDNNGGTGHNARLLFEAKNAGTHYIAAGANGDRTGTYRVSVAEVGDDHPAGNGTTGTVAVGGSAAGEIERAGDRDWFAVTLEAGKEYRVDLEGSPTDAGTLRNPYIRGVHDADGNRIRGTTDNNGGTGQNARLLFEAESAGIYYIAAGANSDRTGTYELSVEEVL